MKYAQIKSNCVVNLVEILEGDNTDPFVNGYDSIQNIAGVVPEPEIGWSYVDGVFAAPVKVPPTLASAKKLKLLEGQNVLNTYFNALYPLEERINLMGLYANAYIDGRVNRLAYTQQLVNYRNTILAAFAAQAVIVQGLATVSEVTEVLWDFSAFTASNPLITTLAAILITD